MASVRCARSVVGVGFVFWLHKLTFCDLIVERFVIKGLCSGRGYALHLTA